KESAFIEWDGVRVLKVATAPNEEWLEELQTYDGWRQPGRVLVIEQMQLFTSNYGVGQEVFDSVFWSGRFVQAWAPRRFERILRAKVRGHLGASKGGDAAVRAALIDRFGPYKEVAIGKKSAPGPLYRIHGHEWQALAVAVTWYDLHATDGELVR